MAHRLVFAAHLPPVGEWNVGVKDIKAMLPPGTDMRHVFVSRIMTESITNASPHTVSVRFSDALDVGNDVTKGDGSAARHVAAPYTTLTGPFVAQNTKLNRTVKNIPSNEEAREIFAGVVMVDSKDPKYMFVSAFAPFHGELKGELFPRVGHLALSKRVLAKEAGAAMTNYMRRNHMCDLSGGITVFSSAKPIGDSNEFRGDVVMTFIIDVDVFPSAEVVALATTVFAEATAESDSNDLPIGDEAEEEKEEEEEGEDAKDSPSS